MNIIAFNPSIRSVTVSLTWEELQRLWTALRNDAELDDVPMQYSSPEFDIQLDEDICEVFTTLDKYLSQTEGSG